MKKLCFFILFILLHFGAQAWMIIDEPNSDYKIVPDSFRLQVETPSSNSDSIVAFFAGQRQKIEYYTPYALYQGYLHLHGVNDGDTVTIRVMKYFNGQMTDSAFRKVIYSLPPKILEYPLKGTIITPQTLLKVKFSHPDTCRVYISLYNPSNTTNPPNLYFGYAKDSVSAVVTNLSVFLSTYSDSYMQVSVYNKKNIRSSVIIYPVYIDSCKNLTEVFTARHGIKDFNFGKVLTHNRSYWPDFIYENPRLVNIQTEQETIIPMRAEIIKESNVYQRGVIFQGIDSTDRNNIGNVYDWYNDSLKTLSLYTSGLVANGNYAVVKNKVKNLETRIDTLLPQYVESADIAENGAYCYFTRPISNYPYSIYIYKDGITDLIATVNSSSLYEPKTDGNIVVYSASVAITYLVDRQGNISLLSNIGYRGSGPRYLVSKKQVAYTKIDAANIIQIWYRDSLGNTFPITSFNNDCKLENFNENGDIIFLHKPAGSGQRTSRYLARRNEPLFRIGGEIGKTYYRDSSWYISIGRTLFRVNVPKALPVKLISFTCSKNRSKNDLVWTTSDEINFSFFEIETSKDGNDFEMIGKVPAAGGNSKYYFAHYDPPKAINYYRLKMVDKDGRFEYSPVRIVNNSAGLTIAVYPNPANNIVMIEIGNEKNAEAVVSIIDVMGRKLSSKTIQINAGINTQAIDISFLNKGTYLIQINISGKEPTTLKFQKL